MQMELLSTQIGSAKERYKGLGLEQLDFTPYYRRAIKEMIEFQKTGKVVELEKDMDSVLSKALYTMGLQPTFWEGMDGKIKSYKEIGITTSIEGPQ